MSVSVRTRSAIVVTSWPGHRGAAELERLAAAGERPRDAYVELARVLDADVIDSHYMAERATPLARVIAGRVGMVQGQVAEVCLRQRRYRYIVAWADRLGLPLALLFKLSGSRRDTVLISVWLSRLKKAIFLTRFRVHTHLRAIVNYGSVQMDIASGRLGVPREQLFLALQPVDERFWSPQPGAAPTENLICSVGWEARDYRTLVEAVRGLDLGAELAVGSTVLSPSGDVSDQYKAMEHEIMGVGGLPPNVRLHRDLDQRALRDLYARSLFFVVPLRDVDYDAGVTALTEAMSMGKAVIVTRTRGQVDLIEDGVQGLYVPPGDVGALRAAIERLRNDPAGADRMGRAGRALVERQHTLDGYVQRLADIVRGSAVA